MKRNGGEGRMDLEGVEEESRGEIKLQTQIVGKEQR